MRSLRVHIGCPIRIDQAPDSISKRVNTLVEDRLNISGTQVAENMHGSIHVSLPRILDIFADFRTRPREVRTRHIHKVSETAHDSTISTMESWIRREVTVISGETGARLHGCESRDTVPHREGTQDAFSK